MNAKDFLRWRESAGLTQQQVADRVRVTRPTVQNWEAGATPIPEAIAMICEVWEARLRQANPDYGPVTLIYSDAPMFVNPYGPRQPLAMMRQEPYPTNAAAIARVQQLWDHNDFHNPFIISEDRAPLWNVVELGRVVDGSDAEAPTLSNLLRRIADNLRANSAHFVRGGGRALKPLEITARQQEIVDQADRLAKIADGVVDSIVNQQLDIEEIFSKLLALGTRAPDALVRNVHQALVVFEQTRDRSKTERRRTQGGWLSQDYRGCEITWPEVRLTTNGWTVNVASNDRYILNKLGGRALIVTDHVSLDNAIAKARALIDGAL